MNAASRCIALVLVIDPQLIDCVNVSVELLSSSRRRQLNYVRGLGVKKHDTGFVAVQVFREVYAKNNRVF